MGGDRGCQKGVTDLVGGVVVVAFEQGWVDDGNDLRVAAPTTTKENPSAGQAFQLPGAKQQRRSNNWRQAPSPTDKIHRQLYYPAISARHSGASRDRGPSPVITIEKLPSALHCYLQQHLDAISP